MTKTILFYTSFAIVLLMTVISIPYAVDVIATRNDPFITGFFVVVYIGFFSLMTLSIISWRSDNESN